MPGVRWSVLQTFLLLIVLLCSQVTAAADADHKAALLRLREAIAHHDVAEVRHIIDEGTVKPQIAYRMPSPLYWVVIEQVDSENLARITQLLLEHFGESNYDYDRHHPLTLAVRHHLSRVVTTLLNWPGTVKEVLAKYLRCEDIRHLPRSVKVVVTHDSHTCFRNIARMVEFEHSELAQAMRHHQRTGEEATPKEFEWSNPFLTPPPGRKPPTKELVMNPRAFQDFSEAVMYYFLGEWGSVYNLTFKAIILAFWLLTCGVFGAAVRG
ncbi:hypothetical protein DQ04_01901100 [Trypanosoma grayi]|uniref:hypothetical protein n=1 Tax=Trypanosoma grayi TaxID=71804 RepID=UPI0004F48B21|nr:hypothetical protein DQ04_01901100 [Trypanosoma grayi]KEG12204.1 hypothetical protein DQ04_01901100 [Trypanosoma grayi]